MHLNQPRATLDASLGPSLADISRHLYALFPPEFVQTYPDAQIEIAYGLPERGPEAARLFNALNGIEAAAAFALARSKAQCNCYVGPALRKAELKSTKRARKADVDLTSFAWCDFDAEGDEIRVKKLLRESGIEPDVLVQTGTIPCTRFQLYFHLDRPIEAVAVEVVNSALRTWLGGDDVHNADRVMRLAGTLSYPNPDKAKRGYLVERTVLKLVPNAPRYRVEHLMSAAGAFHEIAPATREISEPSGTIGTGNGANRPSSHLAYAAETEHTGRSIDELKELLEETRTPGHWHNPMAIVTASLVKKGWPETAIREFCGDYCDDGPNDRDLSKLLKGPYRKGWGEPFTDNSRSYPSEQIRNDARHQDRDLSRPLQILSSAQFIADFTPPDYLIERLITRSFLYSLTGQTGSGKTSITLRLAASVAMKPEFCGLETTPGRVLYLAAENYVDTQMRWIALGQHMDFDPASDCGVYFVKGAFRISQMMDALRVEAVRVGGDFVAVVVDTGPVFFEGIDANDRVAQLTHGRMFRDLIDVIPGRPAVIVNLHPTKYADAENLLPAGGGSFLNEVDGNLTAAKTESSVELHWQGKWRGPEFVPLNFLLKPVTHERLVDSKGRLMPTVICEPLSDEGKETIERGILVSEEALLVEMDQSPRASWSELATVLGWRFYNGKPDKSRVQRMLKKMKKLVSREHGVWTLTTAGKTVVKGAKDPASHPASGCNFEND